jgi:copper chaperone
MNTVYRVAGMTCAHCVAAVTKEVSGLRGVRAVEVDLESGTVRVESDGALPEALIATAVDEAGYELLP